MAGAEQFFATVLPSQGPYVLAFIKNGKVIHKAYDTFSSMEAGSRSYQALGMDCYLCVGSIKDKFYKNKDDKVSPRNQDNIKAVRSLVMDVDVGEAENKYHNKAAALKGLTAFCLATGLPTPTIVDSGYGLHAWWPFTTEIGPERWRPLTYALRDAAAKLDPLLIADPTRLSDYAGLLRVPESVNFKHGMLIGVKELFRSKKILSAEAYETILKPYGATTPTMDSSPVDDGKPSLNLNDNTKPSNIKTIVRDAKQIAKSKAINALVLFPEEKHEFAFIEKKCNWIKGYLETKEKAPEPEWYAMGGFVQFCKQDKLGSEELFHKLSEGHPGYSRDETTKKFRQVQAAQSGPTTCAHFARLNPQRCVGCVYKDLVTTPLQLDNVDVPAPAPILTEEVVQEDGEIITENRILLTPPAPYFRGRSDNGIYMRVGGDEDAEIRKIYDYDLYPIRRLKDEETDNEMLELSLTLPRDGKSLIRIANNCLTDPKKLLAALADKGVLVHPKDAPALNRYILEYARLIQKEEKADEEFSRFGWRDVDTTTPRFVMGDLVVDHTGRFRKATPAVYLDNFKYALSTKGSLDKWRDGFNAFSKIKNCEAQQFAALLGFAAPLMAFTPHYGLVYNIVGQSGVGKSTALLFMTSVWGKPTVQHVKVNDNRIPFFNKMGYLHSIPIAFDELTTLPSDTLQSLVYSITSGEGKDRADRQGHTRKNTTRWQTIVVGTSNTSIYEKLMMQQSGNNAHAYRVFEVIANPTDKSNEPAVKQATALLENNYGLAGRRFITYVIKNHVEVKRLVEEAAMRFTAEFGNSTAERFWFYLFSCFYVGAQIAKKLGLHDYDEDHLIKWFVKELVSVREVVKNVQGDAITLLSHFLQTNIHSTITASDGVVNQLSLGVSINSLLIRIEKVNGVADHAFVLTQALKDYCKKMSVEYGWLLKKLQEYDIVKTVTTCRLSEGTQFLGGNSKCWKIDLQQLVRLMPKESESE